MTNHEHPEPAGVSRRGLLMRGGLLVGAGALSGGVAGGFIGDSVADSAARGRTEPFWGAHQGGIVTDTQQHTVLAAFDLIGADRAELVAMLKAWTALAGALAQGQAPRVPIYAPPAAVSQNAYADATDASTTADSGEATDLGPARLTITIGFGAGLFSAQGTDRYGLAFRRPAALVDLPRFPGDQLAPRDSAWMRGGSYLVYRRIRIALEHWDRLAPTLQEQVIVRRAFSSNNGTTPFTERWPPWRQALEYNAGLLFLAYQKDPRTGFVPIVSQLAVTDALNQFTTHTASAVFAIPPGATQPGDWIGRILFAT